MMVNRKRYIGILKECLNARSDFKDLEYYKNWNTGEETLILSDIVGRVVMLNITGLPEAQILHSLAQIECGQTPANAITDTAEMMRIANDMR